MNGFWKKVTSEQLGPLLAIDELDDKRSRALYDPGKRPDAFIRELAEAGLWNDALKLAARTLPPREAVWWACMCAHVMASIRDKPPEMAALQAAEHWVFKPDEDNRKKAFALAQACDPCLAGGLCAFTATYHDSKLPLVDGTDADLDPSVFPIMVYGAAVMAAGDGGSEQIFNRFEQFLESAEDIANGGDGRMSTAEA